MKKAVVILLWISIVSLLVLSQESTAQARQSSINPNSSEEVNEVLEYFYNAQEQGKVISGQQLREYEHTEVDHVYNLTGKYPAIVGYDMIFSNDGTYQSVQGEREWIVQNATNHWNNGGLVTISWHQTNPLDPYPDVEGWDSLLTDMSQQQFDEMITPGTNLYNKWANHVDMIAGYLNDLQNNGVVVLWRPYHEMNIGSFWWGDKNGQSFIRLWENMYDRLTNYHGLDNLIWVWAPDKGWQASIDNTYFPEGYVDMGGVDVYVEDRGDWAFQRDNDALMDLLDGKPIGIGEVGLLPWTDNFENAYNYSWFLTWTTQWLDNEHYGMPEWSGPGNSPWIIQEVYNHPMTITLDNLNTLQSNNGAPQQYTLPGRIEAENYHGMNGVDTEVTSDYGGGENVGWIDAGNWMDYEVNVNTAGTYTVEYRVASANGGGQFELQSNYNAIDTVTVPNTGGWQNWQTVTSTVYLEEGWNILRIYAIDGGWNINWFNFSLESNNGAPQQYTLPGRIEAENYHGMNGVDTEVTSDYGGGENVGWIDVGNWMDYEVNVNTAGTYTVEYRVASANGGGQFELQSNYNAIDTVTVPNTGGWQNWQTVTSTVYLEEGWNILRIYAIDGGWNINWFNFSR